MGDQRHRVYVPSPARQCAFLRLVFIILNVRSFLVPDSRGPSLPTFNIFEIDHRRLNAQVHYYRTISIMVEYDWEVTTVIVVNNCQQLEIDCTRCNM